MRYAIRQPYDPAQGPWVLERAADGPAEYCVRQGWRFRDQRTLFTAYNTALQVQALEREQAHPEQYARGQRQPMARTRWGPPARTGAEQLAAAQQALAAVLEKGTAVDPQRAQTAGRGTR